MSFVAIPAVTHPTRLVYSPASDILQRALLSFIFYSAT